MDRLAVIESDPATLADLVETAALYDGTDDSHQEMFLRLTDDSVETPASGAGASLASYCTLDAGRFDRLSLSGTAPVDAMFDIDTLLGWLAWVESDRVTVTFEGQTGVTSCLELQAGDDEVRIDCVDDPAVLDAVETFLPERFDETTFLDEEGNPMPTRVETTTDELHRLVRAVELSETAREFPLLVRDGRLAVDIEGESASVTAPLDATTEGPAVTNRYGDEFARIVRGVDGDVTLQTGPGESMACVQSHESQTLRFVVSHL